MSLLLLVGCTTGSTIKEPAVLYEYQGKKITEDDILTGLMNIDQGNIIVQDIESKVMDSLIKEFNYELDDEVKKELDSFKEYAKTLGITMEQFIVYYGFSDEESFNNYVANRVFMEYYAKDTLEKDVEGYAKKYEVRNFVVFSAEDVEQAKKIYQMAKTATIAEIKDTYKKAPSEAMVFTNEYPDLDEKTLNALKTEDVYHAEKTRNVFVFNDVALSDEAIVDNLLTKTNFSTDIFIEAVQSRKFLVHNKILKDLMNKSYPDYMK